MSSDKVLLAYRSKKGETTKYKTVVDSSQTISEKGNKQEISSQVEMVMEQTCTDISADGLMTLEVVIASGHVVRNGEKADLPNVGQKIIMKMMPSGKIVQTSVATDFSQPSFPEEPKAKKDRWNAESLINIPNKPEPIKLDYRYILWDLVKTDGYDCAEIKVSCPETTVELQEGVTQKISATGATYFAYKDGILLKSEVETKTDIEAPQEEATIGTRIRVRVSFEGKTSAKSEPAPAVNEEFKIAGT